MDALLRGSWISELPLRPGSIHMLMQKPANERLARRVAHAAGTFEHQLLGRSPTTVSVVADGDWMVVNLHESFSEMERLLAADEDGLERVQEYHTSLLERSFDSFVSHVRRSTGFTLRSAVVHVDSATGSVLKTLTTHSALDLFVLGAGVPALGVPVNSHTHVNEAC